MKRERQGEEQGLRLNDVLQDADFAPLRKLLEKVANRPVTEFMRESSLAKGLREKFAKKAEAEGHEDLYTFFLIACEKLEGAHKRAHVTSEEHSPGQ